MVDKGTSILHTTAWPKCNSITLTAAFSSYNNTNILKAHSIHLHKLQTLNPPLALWTPYPTPPTSAAEPVPHPNNQAKSPYPAKKERARLLSLMIRGMLKVSYLHTRSLTEQEQEQWDFGRKCAD